MSSIPSSIAARGRLCGVAPNAKEAISLAITNEPDVVLMDVYLGGTRDGIEAGRWLRDVCEVSVVFVTAHSDDGTLERIREVVLDEGADTGLSAGIQDRAAKAIRTRPPDVLMVQFARGTDHDLRRR
jgi:DNA-binding NarL/FixJ family response regulator